MSTFDAEKRFAAAGHHATSAVPLIEQLEALVDGHSLLDVLTGLELICSEKAEHIRHNWQDRVTARTWDKASRVCGSAARKVDV